jgi:hypothetical protein
MSEEQLGFRPQPAVRWLAPRVLVSTGIKAMLAGIFGSYADKRELQSGLPARIHDHGDADELWFDYVADLGDGFDASYSVASLLAAPALELDGQPPLPRGRLLVMGGDEVYPAASSLAYEDRTKGVYRAASPVSDEPRTLFALPGNHDWYDGLTAFLRVFAQGRPIGGWSTEQTRSYFAVELPQRWWLFAIDTQFDEYIDTPQLEYFRSAAANLRPGDAVILCTPTPAWVRAGANGETRAYDIIDFFDREIVQPTGATTRVMLSGDSHHYARYAERDGTSQRITSGAGGAYLTATHLLPQKLVLPPQRSRVPNPPDVTTFDLKETYPSHDESAGLAKGIFRLPLSNPAFWGLTAVLQTVLALFAQIGLAASSGPQPTGLFSLLAAWTPAAFMTVTVLLAGDAFAKLGRTADKTKATVAGFAHSLVHLALTAGWAAFVFWLQHNVLPANGSGDWITVLIVLVATPVLVGFVDAELVALYLLVASRAGINLNEVFAGQSIEDCKGFLRLHISAGGELTIYPVKVPRVCRRWRANPDGAATDPWLVADERDLKAELVEPPIRVPRAAVS